MLIRIAPEMFRDQRFDCLTVQEVCDEIFRTQRFKTKYPWRATYKDKIQPSSLLKKKGGDYDLHFATIEQLLDAGAVHIGTGKAFGLSFVDKRIAAYVTTYDLEISSTDNSLIGFLQQEFSRKNHSPLAVLNGWIETGLIRWNENVRKILEDWDEMGEPIQPVKDKKQFLRLTGIKYMGP
jgi:hypothetical protein